MLLRICSASMERLRTIAPQLAAGIAAADRESVQQIVARACRLAVAESGLVEERASDALRSVAAGREDAAAAAAARALSDKLDDGAWTAEAKGDGAAYDRLFRRARAASALGYAARGEQAEAIYEAAHAFETPDDLLRLLGDGRR
jgi:hypothetical protein